MKHVHAMRFLPLLLIFLALPARAQMGKQVSIPAGSPEDKAMTAVISATDPAQKIQLLDQFMKDFGDKPDMALLANIQYTSAYIDAKDYDQALAHAEKALAADPGNFEVLVNATRAASSLNNAQKVFDYGDRAFDAVAKFKSAPAPEGTSADQWKQQQTDTLAAAQPSLAYIEHAELASTYGVQDGSQRAALLEQFLKNHPDSAYAPDAHQALPFAYEQANQPDKMMDAANAVLAKDPANAAILVMLADYYSDKGTHLEDASSDAKKALDTLAAAKKPDTTAQADWDNQQNLQKGIIYSAQGQIDVIRGRNAQAVASFKQANPLVQSSNYYYGRNLYRLGYTLAKMQDYPEAQKYLQQAVAVDSPYKPLAQQTLAKIGGSAPAHKTHP